MESVRVHGEIMQKYLCTLAVLLSVVIALNASTKPNVANNYSQGTVLSVHKNVKHTPETTAGTSPTDAPLQSEYYAYEVSVRVACNTYVGRYETPFNYLPSSFTPNHAVDVRLGKHVLYFSIPGEPEMKMAIVRQENSAAGCGQMTSAH
jgi:hypothetical protein